MNAMKLGRLVRARGQPGAAAGDRGRPGAPGPAPPPPRPHAGAGPLRQEGYRGGTI
eukprot:COSAG03_NODE_704_length_6188_cov_34.462309_2_plen_56_part_00